MKSINTATTRATTSTFPAPVVSTKMQYSESLFEDVVKSIYEPRLTDLYTLKENVKLVDFKLPADAIIAGGSVVNYLKGIEEVTDYDIFFYGTRDYNARLEEFMSQFKGHVYKYIRTQNFVEFETCNFKIQVILTKNKDILGVINFFDLYACQVAYTNNTIYGTRRAKYALRHNVNIFDINKANTSYLYRLRKYQNNKGFKVLFPNGIPNETIIKNSIGNATSDYENFSETNEITNIEGVKLEGTETNTVKQTKGFVMHYKNIKQIIFTNIKYALGEDESFIINTDGPYVFKKVEFIMSFKYELEQIANGKSNCLKVLGETVVEILNKFDTLDSISPMIKFEPKLARFKAIKADDQSFYKCYDPLLTLENYKTSPYATIVNALDTDEQKIDVLKTLSFDSFKYRMRNHLDRIVVTLI
jgi:hypothetical protein